MLPVWKVDRPIGFLGSYATPPLYQASGGAMQIVVAGAVELTGYQAKTGERRTHVTWRFTKGLPYVTGALLYDHVLYVIRTGGILYTFDPDPANCWERPG